MYSHGIPCLAAGGNGYQFDVLIAQQLHDGLALNVVVLDDKKTFCPGRGEGLDPIECCNQPIGGGSLDEIRKCAVGKAMVAVFFHQRDDLHRDMACGGIELELVQYRPPEHVREGNVEGDGRRMELTCEGQTHPAFGRDDTLESLVPCQVQENASVMRVILD